MRHKYRAWDKVRQRMYSPSEISSLHFVNGQPGIMMVTATDSSGYENDRMVMPGDYILEDYIEREDMNGKDIFEGDIDKYDGRIQWSNEDLAFVTNIRLLSKLFEPEIIGNIHENPELLPYK